jgi:hypothetical protein
MTAPNPIPAGSRLDAERASKKPDRAPLLPAAWTATVLLSPFGDSISPLPNGSQFVVGRIECSSAATENWMRAVLYLTQNQRFCEFVFVTADPDGATEERHWYWIDSSTSGAISNIYGPFPTTLRVPGPSFFANALWGNSYPLMCTDTNKEGIDCNHWLLPLPGPPGHGSWCSFRRNTGQLFRILMVDSTNPLMLPIIGSYFMANLPSFANGVSRKAESLMQSIRSKQAEPRRDYWNPMVTQQDVQRAMAFPLASAPCTPHDIEAVISGFSAVQSGVGLPCWSDNTYAEGWSIGADFVPYFTRICYLWTGDAASKQQTLFIGVGARSNENPYSTRSDTCLNTNGTAQPHYEWQSETNDWAFRACIEPAPPVGLPHPDWLARDGAVIMGKIRGNPQFGLEADQTLNLIAAQAPRGGGELAIFWVWFLENGTGTLFTEGNYINPLSHNLQLIDYTLFTGNAGLTQDDFSNPCGWPEKAIADVCSAHGHFTKIATR